MSVVSGTPVREWQVSVIKCTGAQVPTGSGRRGEQERRGGVNRYTGMKERESKNHNKKLGE